MNPISDSAPTADEALQRLKASNERFIAGTARFPTGKRKSTGGCGDIAGGAQAVPILVGLGVDELGVSLPSIPMIKAQVRRLSYADCRDLAQRALNCRMGDEARSLLPEVFF